MQSYTTSNLCLPFSSNFYSIESSFQQYIDAVVKMHDDLLQHSIIYCFSVQLIISGSLKNSWNNYLFYYNKVNYKYDKDINLFTTLLCQIQVTNNDVSIWPKNIYFTLVNQFFIKTTSKIKCSQFSSCKCVKIVKSATQTFLNNSLHRRRPWSTWN